MKSRDIIKQAIYEVLEDVTGITSIEENTCLVGTALSIPPACFLYIFEELEKRLELPVCDVLTSRSYTIMSISNLTDAFMRLIE